MTSIEDYFKIPEVRQVYLNEWNNIRFYSIINDNPNRSRSDCFELIFDILIKIQPGLSPPLRGKDTLREKILIIYKNISKYFLSLFRPLLILDGVYINIRNAISIRTKKI